MKIRFYLIGFYCIVTNCLAGQDTLLISQENFHLKISSTHPNKTQATEKEGTSFLKRGIYKIEGDVQKAVFRITDSGYVTGFFKLYRNKQLSTELLFINGNLITEKNFSNGSLFLEQYDSTATVKAYNNKANKWVDTTINIKIEKHYNKHLSETRISYLKTHNSTYKSVVFRNGILIYERVSFLYEKKFNNDGQLSSEVVFNWKQKSIETSYFKNGKLSEKQIQINKDIKWGQDGSIQFPENNKNETVTTSFYDSNGKTSRKETNGPTSKTVIDYDATGKVINIKTYKITKGTEASVTSPAQQQ